MSKEQFIDKRQREYVDPVRIVYQTEEVGNADMLLGKAPAQPVFANMPYCLMKKGASVILDFGRELNGAVRLITHYIEGRSKTAELRIRFGESVSETMAELGEKNAGNNHTARDITFIAAAMGAAEYGETGFRFIKIDVLNDVAVQFQKIHAVYIHDTAQMAGSFACDDPLLNRIWQTGAYTVHLNMQNYIFDGIKRDRLVWIGDMHPEVSTICSVYGEHESVYRSLDFVRNGTPADQWMNNIPTYSMWWLIIQYDWYMQNGNLDYLNEQRQYITDLINNAAEWIAAYKITRDFDRFVDWSSHLTECANAGVMAIFILGFRTAKNIFKLYNDEAMARKCDCTIAGLLRRSYPYAKNKQIAALVSLAGIADSEKIYDEILSKDLLHGLSTFLGYYTLLAMGEAGKHQEALDIIRRYWGGMLKMGATSFWEDFDLAWTENAFRIDELPVEGKADIHGDFGKFCYTQFRHSLCHGWASGSTPFLSRCIMGVEILESGCKKVKITPRMCDLKWVKGAYPTPYGSIEIEHCHDKNGRMISKIKAPDEVEILR